MDRIYNGADRAHELGFKTYRDFMTALSKRINLEWGGEVDEDPKHALKAFIVDGRWAAECECGESYYVDPSDPIGYCYGKCGNAVLDGKARKIIFPPEDERAMIETVLLERELEGVPTAISRLGTQAALARNIIHPKVLPRNWDGQTVDELRREHEKVAEIVRELKEQKKQPEPLPAPETILDHIGRAEKILEEIRKQNEIMKQEREKLESARKKVEGGHNG